MQKKYKAALVLLVASTLSMTGLVISKTDSSRYAHEHSLFGPDTNTPVSETFTSAPQNIAESGISALSKVSLQDTQGDAQDKPVIYSPIERIRAIQSKTELHHALLEDHRAFKRYPEYNRAFEQAEQDPVVQRYQVDERVTENPDDGSTLTIWTDKKYYMAGDQVTIYARLQDEQGESVASRFMAQLIYNERDSLASFELLDQDGDGIYQHQLLLNSANQTPYKAGVYKLLIINSTNRSADAMTFILSQPDIQLTGNFRDRLTDDGALLIQAEVDIRSENRYYLQASLYSANQLPIGTAQVNSSLPPGKHWVNLVFDGQLIADSGESSPFLLKHLSLAKVAMPIQRAPLSHLDYFTKEYASEHFKGTSEAIP